MPVFLCRPSVLLGGNSYPPGPPYPPGAQLYNKVTFSNLLCKAGGLGGARPRATQRKLIYGIRGPEGPWFHMNDRGP